MPLQSKNGRPFLEAIQQILYNKYLQRIRGHSRVALLER